MSEELKFPDGFLWGTATSAHQVEGNNHNDWTEWENSQKRINELKKDGKNPEDFISGRACDHYNLYEQDFDIVKSLGQNAHRFSIEWSRIEPEEGKFDHEEMIHYVNVVRSLRNRGIEPFVTLWHFTNPVWFAKKGGFLNKKSPEIFARYCEYVVSKLGDSAKFWITINEPMIYSDQSYMKGIWPPFKKNIFKFIKVVDNLITSHNLVYKKMKGIKANLQIGIAKNNMDFDSSRFNFIGRLAQLFRRFFWNHYFLKKISGHQDFIGLNFYFHKHFGYKVYEKKSDLGWPVYPPAIHHVLMELKKYHKPIYITENGIADAKDTMRAKFIKDHLYWVNRAIHDGVDVRGYFYWSLLDNFEWAHGFGPRFGLVEMDYDTMERKIRPSAYEYKKICESNSLETSN